MRKGFRLALLGAARDSRLVGQHILAGAFIYLVCIASIEIAHGGVQSQLYLLSLAFPGTYLVTLAFHLTRNLQQAADPWASIGDIRIPRVAWIMVALATAVVGSFLWLSRDFQFYLDEWAFVLHQPSTPGAYFIPHNGHWSTAPILSYQVLLGTVGMRSHVPYMAAVLLLHALTCLLLFRILRRRTGDLLALLGAGLLLVLGWGSDDFLNAFQVGFQGSILAGLLAIDLLEARSFNRWRGVAVTCALLVSVASSGIGLTFLAAIAVQLLLEPNHRRRLLVLALPVAAYATWFLAVGAGQAQPASELRSLRGLLKLGAYVVYGTGAGVTGIAGIGQDFGNWVVFVAVIPLAALVAVGNWRRLDGRVLGPLAGIIVEFIAAGAVRLQLGITEAGDRRYLYVAAVFLMLLASPVLARIPWRQLTAVLLSALLLMSLVGNFKLVHFSLAYWDTYSATQNVELGTLNALRGAPDLDMSASPDSAVMPLVTAGALFPAEDRLGSPVVLGDIATLSASNPVLVDTVLRAVFSRAVRFFPAADQTMPACHGTVTKELRVPSGGSVLFRAYGAGTVALWIGSAGQPSPVTATRVEEGVWELRMPDTGRAGIQWRVQLRPSPPVSLRACESPGV